MSRETEKVLKQLMQYMEAHQDELDSGVSEEDLAERFMEEYSASLPPRNVQALPQTADDYLELAEDATSKKKKREYLSKALELEPDNLDAARMAAELDAKKPEDLLQELSALIEKGNSQMEKGGYFRDSMGEFWLAFETRPYMRLRDSYLELLIQCGMMRKAVGEAEEMLKLSTNDNLGVRYTLMHLYAYLENEDGALALHKKYDEYEESQMLLPLAVLYYKKGNFELSLQKPQKNFQFSQDIQIRKHDPGLPLRALAKGLRTKDQRFLVFRKVLPDSGGAARRRAPAVSGGPAHQGEPTGASSIRSRRMKYNLFPESRCVHCRHDCPLHRRRHKPCHTAGLTGADGLLTHSHESPRKFNLH